MLHLFKDALIEAPEPMYVSKVFLNFDLNNRVNYIYSRFITIQL